VSQRRVRVGVVGAGRFAVECHVPGVQAHPRGDVVALCARNRERTMALAARLGVPEVYTDYRELIARPDIDAITVATPDALHLPVAVAALEAGKHVFCEKPLAMTVAEARTMVEVADRSGRVAMVAFTFRYARALQELRRLLRQGAVGMPFYVAMQVHWGGIIAPGTALTWREQAGESAAGIWADGGAHLFDALAYALAPAQEVCAQMMIVPREDGSPQPETIDLATALARLRLPGWEGSAGRPSGYADREPGTVHVSLLASRVDRPREGADGIHVVGTHGALHVSLTRGQHERVSLLRAGSGTWEDVALPDDATTDRPLALVRMMGAFVDAVLRGHLDPEQDPSFVAGLHTQLALDAGLRSARSGSWEDVGG
jgi:predicted dehydrogenase